MDFVKSLEEHIAKANEDKYVGKKGRDLIDYIYEQGGLVDFATFNAIKYLTRYRKLKNKVDLLKATHYIKILYERGDEE